MSATPRSGLSRERLSALAQSRLSVKTANADRSPGYSGPTRMLVDDQQAIVAHDPATQTIAEADRRRSAGSIVTSGLPIPIGARLGCYPALGAPAVPHSPAG
jgi:hypothetical protein